MRAVLSVALGIIALTSFAKDMDATLKAIRVGGTLILCAGKEHFDFTVDLTGSPVAVPLISVAPNSANATAAIVNTSLVATARITVTAGDGVTRKLYTVRYQPRLLTEAIDPIAASPHPRVFLTPASVKELRQKIAAPVYAEMWQELQSQANAILARGIKSYVDVAQSDPEELWQRTVGNDLTVVAFAWLMTRERRYFEFARSQALAAIRYKHWGTAPDLSAGHLLEGIGIAYDWLHSDLTADDRTTLAEALIAQGDRMHHGAVFPMGGGGQWWQRTYLQNHLWVNMTGLTVAGLAVLDEANRTTVEPWLRTALEKFSRTMQYLGDDGASHEGPSYWNYGAEYLFKFADLARTRYRYDLFKHEWLAKTGDYKIAMFYPRNSWTATGNNQDFGGDAERVQWGGPDYLLRKLASEYRNGVYQWYASQVDRAGIENPLSRWLNLLWFDPTVAEASPAGAALPVVGHFADLGIVSMRSAWSGDESIVNFKCGPFMGKTAAKSGPGFDLGAGHVHPDANHFTIFGAGEWQLKDDGYAFKTTSNHSTLLTQRDDTSPLTGQLGDGQQWFAPDPLIATTGMPSMRVASGSGFWVAEGDGKYAYPGSEVSAFHRFLIYQPSASVLIVIDDVALNQATRAELRFFPQSQTGAKQSDGGIFLAGKKSNLRIVPLTPEGVACSLEPVLYATRGGMEKIMTNAIRLRKGPMRTWRNATAFIWDSNDEPRLKNVKWSADPINDRWRFHLTDGTLFQFDWGAATRGDTSVSTGVAYPAPTGSDSSIAGLFVAGQGIPIMADRRIYEVGVNGAGGIVPKVSVAPNDPDAAVTIVQAAALPGTAMVTVKSGDGTHTAVYRINLRLSGVNADGSFALAGTASNAGADGAATSDRASDGIYTDPDNYFAGNAATAGGVAWITFDLGRVRPVNRVDIAWRPANSRSYTYNVEISTDNTNWTTVVATRRTVGLLGPPQYEPNRFTATPARYVRINGFDNSQSSPALKWIAICEARLFGPVPE